MTILRTARTLTLLTTALLTFLSILFVSSTPAQEPAPPPPAESASPSPAPPAAPAPISQGYLYVEPYQARFEALFDARTVLLWQNPQAVLPETLTAADQNSLTDSITTRAEAWCQVRSGGKVLPGSFLGAEIIKGRPAATLPLEEGAEVALKDAMVGLMWEFPTPPAPEDLSVEWQGFGPFQNVVRMPVRVFFGPKSEMLSLSREQPQATWKNGGRLPPPAALAEVPAVPAAPVEYSKLVTAGIALGIGLLGFVVVILTKRSGPVGAAGPLACLAMVAFGGFVGFRAIMAPPPPAVNSPKEAEAILTPLLRNVYRAFDHREEGEIYDVLARSVDGELLRQLYLETIQALTLEGREGTRVTINEFSADILDLKTNPRVHGFITDCQWTALGSVGHWGHTHQRVNRYNAQVTVAPVQSAWKIVKLDVAEVRRL